MQWISRLFCSIITQIIFNNVCEVDLTHPTQEPKASLALKNILMIIITALLCKLHFHFHTKTIIFYMITTRQVCVCRARPIFCCAAKMCFVQGPRVPQVTLFLAMPQGWKIFENIRLRYPHSHSFAHIATVVHNFTSYLLTFYIPLS